MAEVVLHGAQIGALIGKVVAARVPEHVRPDPAELRLLSRQPDDVVDGLPGELGLPLGDEQPGQAVHCDSCNNPMAQMATPITAGNHHHGACLSIHSIAAIRPMTANAYTMPWKIRSPGSSERRLA